MKTLTVVLLTGALAFAGDTREDAARKLEMRISLELRDAKLSDAVRILHDATALNFVVEEGAETAVRLIVRDVSVKSALRLILQPAGLGAAFENGAVVIRSRQNLAGAVTLRIYDVRSAIAKIRDFPGPRVELGHGGGGLFGLG